jgi:hypothetical protein
MNNQQDNQRESAASQVLTVETPADSEKQLNNATTPEIASGEKAKTSQRAIREAGMSP